MPFHLVTGRANAGKSGIVWSHAARAAESGQPVVFIVPTEADVRRTRFEYAAKLPAGVEVTTFDRWLEQLWGLHGDGSRLITEGTREALVARAIAVTPKNATQESSQTPGFQKMVMTVVSRLCGLPTTPSDAAGSEIAAIARAYLQCTKDAGLIEPAQAAALLATAPPALPGVIVVNRFVDLSEAQERLLVALSSSSQVVLSLVWEADFAATEAVDALVSRLGTHGEHTHLESPPPVNELMRLESCLYGGRYAEAPRHAAESAMLELGIAAGRDAELELIAIKVGQILGQGISADRVAVAFRNPRRSVDLHAKLIGRGVPAALDVAVPFRNTPYGRALLALLEVVMLRQGRETLYAFLASPYSGADHAAVIEADRAWRRARRSDAQDVMASVGRMGSGVSQIVRDAQALAKQGVTHTTGRKWKSLADRLLVHNSDERGQHRALDAAAHRAFVRTVESLRDAGLESVSASDLVSALRDVAVTVSGADQTGRVQITDVSRLKSRRFEVVILAGLTADEFAAEHREPLAARYARALGGAGGTDERLSERMLFYLLVTRARTRLILVRQGSDESGEPLSPSVFWEEVLDLYRHSDDDVECEPELVPVTKLGSTELAAAFPSTRGGRDVARAAAHGQRLKAQRALHVALESNSLASLAQTEVFSVTELEQYLRCPYLWFHSRSVRPREIDRQIDARTRGSLVHELLSAFYDRFAELGHARVLPDNVEQAEAIFDAVAEGVLGSNEHLKGLSLSEALSVRGARRLALATVTADAGFMPDYRPVAHEMRFGMDSAPAVTIDGVGLRGSVDRVDSGPQGLVVIDYKSGGSQVCAWSKFEAEGLLQPALYALAVERLLGREVVAAGYRRIGTTQMRGYWRKDLDVPLPAGLGDAIEGEEAEAVIASARERMMDAVEGIRSGRIDPAPLSPTACKYCAVRCACPEAVA